MSNSTSPFLEYAPQLNPLTSSLSPTLLTTLASLAVGALYIIYIREATPLRKIPGPLFASISKIWLIQHTRRSRRHEDDYALHKRYGPVVRVGPSEVMIAHPEAVTLIYAGAKTWRKAPWYIGTGGFTIEGFDLLGENNMEKYKLQRRIIAPVYSPNSVKDFEKLLDTQISKHVNIMQHRPLKEADINAWCTKISLDCLSIVTFSESEEVLTQEEFDDCLVRKADESEYMAWVGHMVWLFWANEFFEKKLGFRLYGPPKREVTDIFDWYTTRLRKLMKGQMAQSEDTNIANKLIDIQKGRKEFRDDWLVNMTMTGFGAGTDTIGVIISVFLYYAVVTPGLQERLHKEIDEARSNGLVSSSPQFGQKQSLPLLEAVLSESTRLHPSIAHHLPRVVPEGGLTVEGTYLPAGTIVGVNPWVVNRDRSIFGEDSEVFRPERWLEMTAEDKVRVGKYSLEFGKGARSCVGQHLAPYIYTKAIMALVLNFNWEFANPAEQHSVESKFEVRLKDVVMKWTPRT